jgi:AraC family transcriptional regulator of adaptative response/methylated-DNA-[protein]-cysteine methyltransferase
VRVHIARIRVPLLGLVHLAATASGVVQVRLDDDDDALRRSVSARFPDPEWKRGNVVASEAARQIRRYLDGGPDPDVDVVIPEKGFSARVWRQIRRIPRGEVRSYGRVARALGRPEAVRAVGQSCGRNPVPLLVPCHRVVASDGGLGGYTGGVEIKRRLLALEGVTPRR